MIILQILIYATGLLAVTLTLLPFLKLGFWWIRIGDFPRLQIAFICALSAVLFSITARPLSWAEIGFPAILIVCAVYQMFSVLSYLPFYPKQVEKSSAADGENTISLLIFNVFIENRYTQKLLDLVERVNPDLILLAEPDERWLSDISALEKNYPYTVQYPLDNAYGLALYSRLEPVGERLNFFVDNDIPSISTQVKLASGKTIDLYCLHPRPPVPTESERSDERDAELLLVGKMINETDAPTIIAGDLNDVAWSRTTKLFQNISGLLDPRVGRGLYSSFHAKYPLIRFPLDHVFHSNHFRLVKIERQPNIGSDHFPIYIALNLEATAELTQTEPTATTEEKREADETIIETFEMLKEEEKR